MVTSRESRVFRALADPTRRSVYERLARGETAVKALTASFRVSQPAISQHLATLRRAGLVKERREGRHVYYRAEPAGLRPLVSWTMQQQKFWMERLERLETLLAAMDSENQGES